MKQSARVVHDSLQVADLFDGPAGHPQNGGEEVGCVRERYGRVRAFLGQRFVEHDIGFSDERIGAANCTSGNVF